MLFGLFAITNLTVQRYQDAIQRFVEGQTTLNGGIAEELLRLLLKFGPGAVTAGPFILIGIAFAYWGKKWYRTRVFQHTFEEAPAARPQTFKGESPPTRQ